MIAVRKVDECIQMESSLNEMVNDEGIATIMVLGFCLPSSGGPKPLGRAKIIAILHLVALLCQTERHANVKQFGSRPNKRTNVLAE